MTLDTIWADYHGRLRAFLRARVANPADVDDLLQDILLKVGSSLNQLEDQTKLHAWLFQTAQRTIIDHYRKSAQVRRIDPDDLWYRQDDQELTQSLERCVEPFLQALSPKDAELLSAIDLEGIAQKAYAEQHGIPYSTLKSRVSKARANLRDLFETCCTFSRDTRGNLKDFDQKSGGCKEC